MTTNRNTLTRNRLTNNSDETDIGALISGDNIRKWIKKVAKIIFL